MTAKTRGNWGNVWQAFDRRMVGKNATAANEDETDGDMFSRASK